MIMSRRKGRVQISELGNTEPDVILKRLTGSLLKKKLQEYYDDQGWPSGSAAVEKCVSEDQQKDSDLNSDSSSDSDSKCSDKGPKLKEPESISVDSTTQTNVNNLLSQQQPSPDSTSSALIDLTIKYRLKEFDVVVDPLEPELLEKAQNGSLDWKKYYKSGQIIEKVKAGSRNKVAAKKKHSSRRDDDYESEEDNSDVESSSHGSSDDEDFELEGRSKPRVRGKPKKDEESLPLLKCDKCSYTSKSQNSYRRHLSVHKNLGAPIKCSFCELISFNPNDHEIHEYECHKGPSELPQVMKISCKSCPTHIFHDYEEFDHHIINHVNPNPIGYSCGICEWSSEKYNSFQPHLRGHIMFQCAFCDKNYAKLHQVERHCSISHRSFGRPFSCSICDFRTATFGLLIEHRESRHAIGYFKGGVEKCKLCDDFVFVNREVLLDHLSWHVNIDLYKCVECDFTARSRASFDDHFVELHIASMLTTSIYCEETNIEKIMDAVSTLMKKKMSKSRLKPTFLETASAVAALLDDSAAESFSTEHDSFFGDLNDLDMVTPPDDQQKSSKKKKPKSDLKVEENPSQVEIEDVNRGRPKRKSFLNAQSKLTGCKIIAKDESSDKSSESEEELELPQPVRRKRKNESDLALDQIDEPTFIPEEDFQAVLNTPEYEDNIPNPIITAPVYNNVTNLPQPMDSVDTIAQSMASMDDNYNAEAEEEQEEIPANPELQTYYDATTKILVINGMPVVGPDGNVAQIEPEEVDEVFQMYSQVEPET